MWEQKTAENACGEQELTYSMIKSNDDGNSCGLKSEFDLSLDKYYSGEWGSCIIFQVGMSSYSLFVHFLSFFVFIVYFSSSFSFLFSMFLIFLSIVSLFCFLILS